MSKTYVRLTGGLGNQLFQLAKAYDLDRESPGTVRLDVGWFSSPSRTLQHRQWELGGLDLGIPLGSVPRSMWTPQLRLAETDHGAGTLSRAHRILTGRRLVDGWWQDAGLVARVKEAVLAVFEQMRSVGPMNELPERTVAVHVRLGDYLSDPETSKFHGVTDFRQQLRLADDICQREGHERIVIFSDQPERITGTDDLRSNVAVSRSDSAWDALLQMSTAATLVMSNSTLSWWSGYLGSVQGQRHTSVWMPHPWFRDPSERDRRLKVPGWNRYDRTVGRSIDR